MSTVLLWCLELIQVECKLMISFHRFFAYILYVLSCFDTPTITFSPIPAVVLSDIRKGTSVKSLCANISTQMLRDFNYALVWGKSAVHAPQRCGLSHKLDDEDVVQIVTKTIKQQQNSTNYASLAQDYQDKHAKKRLEAKKQKQRKLGR